jgi:LEA14-like dessication related protein
MEYLSNNDLWLRVGDVYMISGKDDDMQTNNKNLLQSVLIYNPNDIPIRIKYMIFS